MPTHLIKTGLLSFGMSGKIFHAPFITKERGFHLVAVTERSEKRAHLRYPYIRSYATVDELLDDPQIELVVVNTPNNTHFEYAVKAIKRQKHVLVEKPFTVTSEECKALYRLAQEYNVCVMPYHNRRFDSDFLSVKNVLQSGRLGKLTEMHIRFERFKDSIGIKRFKEELIPGSGLQYDLGSHLLDGVISLFGKPLQWFKTLEKNRPDSQVDDYVHIHLVYPDGLHVYLTCNLLVVDPQPAFVLNGSRGTFSKKRADVQEKQLLEDMLPSDPGYGVENQSDAGTLTYLDENNNRQEEKIEAAPSSYGNLYDALYKTITEGTAFPILEEDMITQLTILES